MEIARVVFLDLLLLRFLSEAAFDGLLLWTTARLAGRPFQRVRLVVAACLGAVYAAWETLAGAGVVPLPSLGGRLILVVLVSWLMLAVTFDLSRPRSLIPLMAPFYGSVAAAAGTGFAAGFLLGDGSQPNLPAAVSAAALALGFLGLLAPRWIRREALQRSSELLVRVEVAGRAVEVVGLLDTGNLLREPLSGRPVVVLEWEAAASLFPESLHPLVEQATPCGLAGVERLQRHPEWAGRWRMIPFSSLGARHGMMLGFRPDRVVVAYGGHRAVTGAMVGISVQLLDAAGRYRALVPPAVVEAIPLAKGGPSSHTLWKGEDGNDHLSTGT